IFNLAGSNCARIVFVPIRFSTIPDKLFTLPSELKSNTTPELAPEIVDVFQEQHIPLTRILISSLDMMTPSFQFIMSCNWSIHFGKFPTELSFNNVCVGDVLPLTIAFFFRNCNGSISSFFANVSMARSNINKISEWLKPRYAVIYGWF